jgi:hypothetical protein
MLPTSRRKAMSPPATCRNHARPAAPRVGRNFACARSRDSVFRGRPATLRRERRLAGGRRADSRRARPHGGARPARRNVRPWGSSVMPHASPARPSRPAWGCTGPHVVAIRFPRGPGRPDQRAQESLPLPGRVVDVQLVGWRRMAPRPVPGVPDVAVPSAELAARSRHSRPAVEARSSTPTAPSRPTARAASVPPLAVLHHVATASVTTIAARPAQRGLEAERLVMRATCWRADDNDGLASRTSMAKDWARSKGLPAHDRHARPARRGVELEFVAEALGARSPRAQALAGRETVGEGKAISAIPGPSSTNSRRSRAGAVQ